MLVEIFPDAAAETIWNQATQQGRLLHKEPKWAILVWSVQSSLLSFCQNNPAAPKLATSLKEGSLL